MGFGPPAALGADRCLGLVVVALVGDGSFGQNPAVLASAFEEEDIAVVWVVMNNCAFGTIAGLELAHYGTTFATVFEKNGKPYSPDYAMIARGYGIEGIRIESAAEFKPALVKSHQDEQARAYRRLHEE
jgi:acetolactate synthase-1/2/3 large subunit